MPTKALLGLLPCDFGERKPCVPTTGGHRSLVRYDESDHKKQTMELYSLR